MCLGEKASAKKKKVEDVDDLDASVTPAASIFQKSTYRGL